MATKPKSTEGQASSQDASPEALLAAALEKFNAGKLKEAEAAFAALQEKADAAASFGLGRTAKAYLKAVRTRLETLEAATPLAAELAVQVELNRRDPDAALSLVDTGLKAHPDHAGLHYLKALALAQLDQAQPAAEALAKATGLEPGLIYQFRLEADFDGVRHSGPFAAFNRG